MSNLNPKVMKLFGGEGKEIVSIAFSSDGTKIAFGHHDGIVTIYSLLTGKFIELYLLNEDENKDVTSIQFSPDNNILASSYANGIISLWPTNGNKEPIHILKGYGIMYSVAFHPNGKILVSGSDGEYTDENNLTSILQLWSVKEGKLIGKLNQEHGVYSLSFNPSGNILAVGSLNNEISFWRFENGIFLLEKRLKEHTEHVATVAFSPDGKILASGSDDKTVKIWYVDEGVNIFTIDGFDEDVVSVTFSPDGKSIVCCSSNNYCGDTPNNGTLKIYSKDTYELINTFKYGSAGFYSVKFSPNGKILAIATTDGICLLECI